MAEQPDPALSSSLSAPASEVPTQQRSTTEAQHKEPQQPPQQPQSQSQPKDPKENGTAKHSQRPMKEKEPSATDGSEKLSPAELKKRAKAEKQARRAREKVEREQPGGGGGAAGQGSQGGKKGQAGKEGAGQSAKGQRAIPRRTSAQAGAGAGAAQGGAPEMKKKEDKNVAVFGHLYGQQRRTTVAGAGKEVHPAVLALGLQMRDYVVCGSSARCVATLLAFKRVSVDCFVERWRTNDVDADFYLGGGILYHALGHFSLPPFDYPPVSPDYLSLDMSSSLDQSGKCDPRA